MTEEEWLGPASAAMAAAAYESAFAATVPPPQIAINRAQLASLVAGNLIGQNTPAIAGTEAQYGEMWAQDAGAMYGYAACSAAATELGPFGAPRQITDAAGVSEQLASVDRAATASAGTGQEALSRFTSSVPDRLQSLSSPSSTDPAGVLNSGGWNPFEPGSAGDTTGLNGVLNALFGPDTAFGQFVNANLWNTVFGSGFYLPSNYLGTGADFIGLSQAAESAADGAASAAAGAAGAAGAGEAVAGAAGNAISAGVGNGALVGPLSVPPSWTAATPDSPLFPAVGATRMIAPPAAVAAGMPAVPLAGASGQGYGRNVPQYGFKPTFVARPPAAG